MKRTCFVLLIPTLLTALPIMSNKKQTAAVQDTNPSSIKPQKEFLELLKIDQQGSLVPAHGVSPLGASSPSRMKRATSAFDLLEVTK